MEKLTWKQDGWTGRKYDVRAADGTAGRLEFKGWSSYNAVYKAAGVELDFTTNGWLQQDVTIRYNGEVVGHGKTSSWGKTTISLVTGERYRLESKSFSQSKTLLDEFGKPVVGFEQSGISGTKGTITVASGVPELTKLVLIGTSLYFKTVSDSQAAILIAIFTPLFLQMIR